MRRPLAAVTIKSGSKRAEAEGILSFAASDGKRLRPACPRGCCNPQSIVPAADRGASVERAYGLVKRFVNPCISEPAANKYTKVDPVMRELALAANFFGLLRRAFARKFKEEAKPEADKSDSDISVDAAIGVPTDATSHWRKVVYTKFEQILQIPKATRQRILAFDMALRVFMHHEGPL